MITPATTTLTAIGQTVQLSATVLDQNGQPIPSAVVTWSSSNTAVATVNSQRLVTAVMNGTAQITARSGTISSQVTVNVTDTSNDREALTALYHATNGPNWAARANWLSDLPLGEWFGVTTNAQGEVTRLELQSNNVQGSIPAQIGQLQSLVSLRLWNNQLSGGIPPEIGQLQNLNFLWLNINRLTGSIPAEIGQLRNLRSLALSRNQLAGTIPAELGQLEFLRDLRIHENTELSGPLPSELTRLTQLRQLYLNGTNTCIPPTTEFHQWLSSIPDKSFFAHCPSPERDVLIALYDRTNGQNWTNSTNWTSYISPGDWFGVTTDADGKVTKLVLPDNNINGLLPSQLSDLASLEVLNLSSNTHLSGSIPRSFTNLDLLELNLGETQVCAPFDVQFQEWLAGVPQLNVSNCTETRRDYYPLAALYHSTKGLEWTNSTNWLSDAPLQSWYGVTTNSRGQVTDLKLPENNLQGPISPELSQLSDLAVLMLGNNRLNGSIPTELGQLEGLRILDISFNNLSGVIPDELAQLQNLEELNLHINQLTGSIPSEIGRLYNLKELSLVSNQLSGEVPPEIGQLQNLRWFGASLNRFTGAIPSELGQLANLTGLTLGINELNGAIPSELGQLANLTRLILGGNKLSGPIPPALGHLTNLEELELNANALMGTIPPELGQLVNLTRLSLGSNALHGPIPPELGQLADIEKLELNANQLTGNIPPELGQLSDMITLKLNNNDLTGTIPPEIGYLNSLEELRLSFNKLTGAVPEALGNLSTLKVMRLTDNHGMSGALPSSFINLRLEDLLLGGTQLCAPVDPDFQAWLRGVPNSRVVRCDRMTGRSTAYLTQATQSLEFPVPLMAGEDALLRVFVTTNADVNITIPLVRATFYEEGTEVYSVDIPGHGSDVPEEIVEGDLSSSANARVPASVVVPGLEMIIEIDPDGELDPSFGISGRLPDEGRMPVEVVSLPPFELTLVPFLWIENPDHAYLSQIHSLTAESDEFRLTRDILPVGDLVLNVYGTQWISVDPGWENHSEVIRLTKVITAMARTGRHYMGVLRDGGGWGERPGTASVSILDGMIIAHELGHNLGLYHTTCGNAPVADPDFPYENGAIGAWGYDLLNEDLVAPDTPDVMGYCRPRWISDYHFSKAMGYRLSKALETRPLATYASGRRSLLLWGGVNEVGELVLEPAFVVDAPPSPTPLGGPYKITGEDQDGRTLFSVSFDMPEGQDADSKAFAFILPIQAVWATSLHGITLSGPEGFATMGGDEGLDDKAVSTAALLLDQSTGQVRGLLRDWPESGTTWAAARRVLPEPGLDVVISSGVPDSVDWDR